MSPQAVQLPSSTQVSLAFIPPLHNLAKSQTTSANAVPPSTRTFCRPPARHALLIPPATLHPAHTRANPSTGPRRQTALAVAAPSRPIPPLPVSPTAPLPTSPSLPSSPLVVRGHRHTAESKRKISRANRGNIPWNKGRPHTEETKRKIAEATRRAMLHPEMRSHLRNRARGRKHTEATKLKIRETARQSRGFRAMSSAGEPGAVATRVRKPKKRPVPFVFDPETVAELNQRVQSALQEDFKPASDGTAKLVPKERRPMAEETKEKLSRRIKAMWADPGYRARVVDGIEQRARRMVMSPSPERVTKAKEELVEVRATSNKKPVKSPKRRARVKPDVVCYDEEEEDFEADSAAELFLGQDALLGFTKEDLGIFGSHVAGPVEVGSAANRSKKVQEAGASHETLATEGALTASSIPVSSMEELSNASSAQSHGRSRTRSTEGGTVDTAPVDSVINKAQRERDDLLASLSEAGQLPSLENDAFIDLSDMQDELGTDELSYELRNIPVDPLDPPASSARQELPNVDEGEEDDNFGFLESNINLLSGSGTDIGSTFVSLPPGGDDAVPSTIPTPDFDMSSFRR